MSQKSEFQKQHANILAPIGAYIGSSQREVDQKALQDSYKLHLEREGLLKINKQGSDDITSLGRLLVRRIGMENVG